MFISYWFFSFIHTDKSTAHCLIKIIRLRIPIYTQINILKEKEGVKIVY